MPTASTLSEVIDVDTYEAGPMPVLSTCHQCRQRTPNFSASCRNVKGNIQCSLKMCHRCLLNRYGEVAQTVTLLEDWKCPKCRGICNCSSCRKKNGYIPTGQLVHKAKENGFASVLDLLHSRVSDIKTEADQSLKISVDQRKRERLAEITISAANNATISLQSSVNKTLTSKENSNSMKTKENTTVLKKRKYVAREGTDKEDANDAKKMTKNAKPNGLSQGNGKLTLVLTGTKNTPKRNSKEESIQTPKQKKKSANEVVEIKRPDIADLESGKINKKHNPKPSNGEKLTHFFNGLNHSPSNNDEDMDKTVRTITSHTSNPLKPHSFIIKTTQNEKKPSLPSGTRVKTISGIDFSPKDVGEALQFLEFCEVFGKKVLNLKKGQADAIIKDLLNNKRQLRSQYKTQHSLLSQTHITLLNLIKKRDDAPVEKHSWVQSLGQIVSELKHVGKDFARVGFEKGFKHYDELKPFDKLRLLNMLCDEALNTKEMRKWIDDQYTLAARKHKEDKEHVAEAKAKEKEIMKKIQEIDSEKGGSRRSLSLLDDEAKKARKKTAEAISVISKDEKGHAFLRTEPCLVEPNGRVFWRLRCRHGLSDLLLQDVKDLSFDNEAWFCYDPLSEDDVHNYLSWFKNRGSF